MEVGERIEVVASFEPGRGMRPLRFRWSGKVFAVSEITYAWKTKEGRNIVHRFSITDGRTLYELSFDPASLIWRLEGLEA